MRKMEEEGITKLLVWGQDIQSAHTQESNTLLSQRDRKKNTQKEQQIFTVQQLHIHTFIFKNTQHRKKPAEKQACTHNTHTQSVHYNETVDARPLCQDPNSCSSSGANHEQGQGETSSKQSQSLETHTHTHTYCIVKHISHTFSQTFMYLIMQMWRHTHWTKCANQ